MILFSFSSNLKDNIKIPFFFSIFGNSFFTKYSSVFKGMSKEKFPISLELNIFCSSSSGSLSLFLAPFNLIVVYSPICSIFASIIEFPGASTLTINGILKK